MLAEAFTTASASSFALGGTRVYELLSRVLNLAIAALALVCLSPLMLLIALAIKLSEPGAPVFYRGVRVGKHGKPFQMLKFRTMTLGTETQLGGQLIARNSSHITTVGKLLRRRKLDELPQLLNVLRGDMKLVGPRPVRPVFLDELRERISGYDRRFLVEPGLTGLAQVRGGYYTDPRNKYRYESLYLQRRSLLLDFRLIAATLGILASRFLFAALLLPVLLLAAVYALSFVLPALPIEFRGTTVNLSPLLAGLLSSGLLLGALQRRQFILRRTSADIYIVCFVIWGVVGALATADPLHNLGGLVYFAGIPFLLYFAAAQATYADPRTILRGVEFLTVVAIVLGLDGIGAIAATRLFGLKGGLAFWLLPRTMSRIVALYLPLMAPLALYLRLYPRGPLQQRFWRVGIYIIAICLLLMGSAAYYIPVIVALLTFLWRGRPAAFVSAALVSLALLVTLGVARNVVGRDGLSAAQRNAMPPTAAITSIGGESEAGLLGGSGYDAAAVHKGRGDEFAATPVMRLWASLDDSYAIFTEQRGIVGLFFALMIVVIVLGSIRSAASAATDPGLEILLWAIFSGAVGFLTSMLFFNCFEFIAVYLSFWLLLGLGTGLALIRSGATPRFYRLNHFSD